MSTNIYYFSGTGNSLKVAKDLVLRLEDVRLVRINKDNLVNTQEIQGGSLGIIFPVYYYGLPHMVKSFIKNLKANPDTYIFAIATCGGSVGAAMDQLKSLLSEKDLRLSAGYRVVMPDNFQILYGPPSEKKQKNYFKNQETAMHEIADVIAKKQQIKFHEKGKYLTKIFGNILSKTFAPKEKDRSFWADDRCNGCKSCVKLCPANNIEMKENKPIWLHQCELCLGCMQWCPKISIQYGKSTINRERYHHPEIKMKELFRK